VVPAFWATQNKFSAFRFAQTKNLYLPLLNSVNLLVYLKNFLGWIWKLISLSDSASIKSSRFAVTFRGISQMDSAFFFLRWFKLAHICIQVTSLQKVDKQANLSSTFLIGNRLHATLRISSPKISIFNPEILFKFY